MQTTEQRAADTILQVPEIIEIAGKKYKAPPPTTATLIRVSELIAKFPKINTNSEQQIIEYVLANAWKCGTIGKIAATLVLGETRSTREKNSFLYRIFNFRKNADELAEIILTRKSPREINQIITTMLARLEIADFFALTTSLTEINILKATKEVGRETTASGLS